MSTLSNDYFKKTQLKDRGWTESLIKCLLGEPDKILKNRTYGGSAMLKYYQKERVLTAEQTQTYKDYQIRTCSMRKKISETQLRAHEERRKKLFNFIDQLDISIPVMEWDILVEQACDHYNDYWSNKAHFCFEKHADCDSDPAFIQRIVMNMIRHQNEHYEPIIEQMFGMTGKQEGYELLRSRIEWLAREKYHELQ